jgi:hypothetical protein
MAGHGHLAEWERQAFSLSLHEVAGRLLSEWKFPEAVVKAVSYDASLAEPTTPLGKNLNLTTAPCVSRASDLPARTASGVSRMKNGSRSGSPTRTRRRSVKKRSPRCARFRCEAGPARRPNQDEAKFQPMIGQGNDPGSSQHDYRAWPALFAWATRELARNSLWKRD